MKNGPIFDDGLAC